MSQATAAPTLIAGLGRLLQLAAAQPLMPVCEHFFFLRHGQTECNAQRIFQATSEPLNAAGLAQAQHAAGLLADQRIASIVASDVRRARATAEVVATRHLLAPIFNSGLRERNFGKLIGTSSRDIDWGCEPEAGETLEVFIGRSRAGLSEALAQPAPALLVAHGGTLYALAGLLGVAVDRTLLGNAQPLRFDRDGDAWRVTALAASSQAIPNMA